MGEDATSDGFGDIEDDPGAPEELAAQCASEARAQTEEEVLARIARQPLKPEFAVVTSAKAAHRKIHLWLGCWRVQNVLDVEPVFNADDVQYDGVCHLCWPRGCRPSTLGGDTSKAILTSAGIANDEDDSSSSESSSSSEAAGDVDESFELVEAEA
jgi:hypothetical protein